MSARRPAARAGKTVSFYLGDEAIDLAAALAVTRGLTKSALVEALLREERGREWRLDVGGEFVRKVRR